MPWNSAVLQLPRNKTWPTRCLPSFGTLLKCSTVHRVNLLKAVIIQFSPTNHRSFGSCKPVANTLISVPLPKLEEARLKEEERGQRRASDWVASSKALLNVGSEQQSRLDWVCRNDKPGTSSGSWVPPLYASQSLLCFGSACSVLASILTKALLACFQNDEWDLCLKTMKW